MCEYYNDTINKTIRQEKGIIYKDTITPIVIGPSSYLVCECGVDTNALDTAARRYWGVLM